MLHRRQRMKWSSPVAVIKSIVVVAILTGPGITADADGGAYYDYRTWSCRIDGNRAEIIGRSCLTVLDPRGDKHANVVLHENRYTKLDRCDISVRDGDGNIIKQLDKKDMTKTCGFGADFQVYSDICYYDYEHLATGYPYTITFEYKSKLKSLFFWNGVDIQSDIPIDSASYILTCPHDFLFHHILYRSDDEPVIEKRNKHTIYTWVFHDIPGEDYIPYAPDGYPETLSLQFTADNLSLADQPLPEYSWRGIGQWYAGLAADCYDLDETERPPTDPDPRRRAQTILKELTDNYRYVSVSIGISGWRPHPAKTTAERRFGDCKDLTTLLVSRLRASGITACPCLILTRGQGKLDTTFPGFEFNHVIAAAIIDNDTIWMDPTCFRCPFGEIPEAVRNLPALMITDRGGVLVTTAATAPDKNSIIKRLDMTLHNDLSLDINAGIEYHGYFGRYFRNSFDHMDRDESLALIRNIIPGGGKRYELTAHRILNPDDRCGPISIELTASRKKKLKRIGGAVYVRPELFSDLDFYSTIELDGRTDPIDITPPRTFAYTITIKLDDTYRYDSITIPKPDSAVFDFGETFYTCSADNAGITIDFSLTVKQDIIPPEDFDAFDTFRQKLNDLTDQYIKIH